MGRDAAHDVVIVGAGFAGLYAIHQFRQRGYRVLCLEAADGIGGTWYHNRYPGARCDVRSIDYSYSFDEDLQQEWEWSELYAAQPEILAYIEHVADRFDLMRDIRLNTRVIGAEFDERRGQWTVRTEAGETEHARYLLFATGPLSVPLVPEIEGIDEFGGEIYQTSQWPHEDPDLTGKRVALFGTGSSGIQASVEIAKQAGELTVFQRSPNYTVPMPNRPLTAEDQEQIRREYPERRRQSRMSGGGSPHVPHPDSALDTPPEKREEILEAAWQEGGVLFSKAFPDQFTDIRANDIAREFAERKIREIVDDPQIADDLTPKDHPIGTKRICTDDGYYEMFNQEHVHLVNVRREPVERVTPTSIVTSEAEYEADVIVLATGFDAMTGALMQVDITGAEGRRLDKEWADGPVTYLGLQVPGFPNLFSLNGPGSPAVLANMVLTAEQQVEWIADLIAHAEELGYSTVEARDDSAKKWTDHVGELADKTLFTRAESTWYLGTNVEGKKRTFMLYAAGLGNYRQQCDAVAENDYEGFVLAARSAPPEGA